MKTKLRNGFYDMVVIVNPNSRTGRASLVETTLGKMGTPICFDFDYTLLMRRMTADGAKLFAVPSFDAKRWSVTQHKQHSAILPVRAAENGRWVVCAASSGISQIIDPHGNIHQNVPAMKEGTIAGAIEPIQRITFYTRIGWLFPWLCMALVVLFVLGIVLAWVWKRKGVCSLFNRTSGVRKIRSSRKEVK